MKRLLLRNLTSSSLSCAIRLLLPPPLAADRPRGPPLLLHWQFLHESRALSSPWHLLPGPPSLLGWLAFVAVFAGSPTARPFVPLAGVHAEMEGKVFLGFWPAPLLLSHGLAFRSLYYCPPELQPPASRVLSPQSRSSFRMPQPSATVVASPRTSRCTHTVDPGQGLLPCTCHDYARLPCILQLRSRSPSPNPAIWWGGRQG